MKIMKPKSGDLELPLPLPLVLFWLQVGLSCGTSPHFISLCYLVIVFLAVVVLLHLLLFSPCCNI